MNEKDKFTEEELLTDLDSDIHYAETLVGYYEENDMPEERVRRSVARKKAIRERVKNSFKAKSVKWEDLEYWAPSMTCGHGGSHADEIAVELEQLGITVIK